MKKFFLLNIFLFIMYTISGANLSIDEMQIISDINFDSYDNKLKNNTFFKLQTSFQGGYKFSAKATFSASTAMLESSYLNGTNGLAGLYLIFNNASVTARDLFNSMLELSIWTGSYKYLGSGNIYKGYLFFPKTDTLDIQGFYRLRGTGVSANVRLWEDKFRIKLHLYNNTNFILPTDTFAKLNFFSFDNEIGLYLDYLYLELFYGFTKDIMYPNKNTDLEYGRGKIGFTFWVGNKDIEFFTTIGIPDLDKETFSQVSTGGRNLFDSLYLIAELKFNLYITKNIISFLTTPALYNEVAKTTQSDFNVNYKLLISSPDKLMNGGTHINFTYHIMSDATQSWNFTVAPYFSIVLSGVEWFLSTGYDFSKVLEAQTKANDLISLEGLHIIFGVTSNF
ncbi:MAG TPA: hypothetical protein DDY71_14755 [Spirochaetia bacterium]|nr:MAG: hypothetical protein A2Y30_05635 [Spirochaetes bacterium GWE1_32_154]OHD49469.1 MAG: hypothetical protein A2Y29_01695 [Spirochaetes bacterium GWE2_31_10]HBI38899.1 hypothetical protein [Spirochaetia bacterium]